MNITVSRGNAAFLPCPSFTNFTRVSVVWLMDGVKLCTYFIDSKRPDPPKCGPRFKVNIKPSGLNITGVESSDAGTYMCEMIKLLEPPTDFKNSTHRLQVNGDYILPFFVFYILHSYQGDAKGCGLVNIFNYLPNLPAKAHVLGSLLIKQGSQQYSYSTLPSILIQ